MLEEILDCQLNPVLKMLKEALNGVEIQYIEQYYFRLRGSQIQKPERTFVAELYHQLRMQQSTMNKDETIRNLVFHCDISKINYILNNECIQDVSKYRLVPDLVLHKSQTDNSSENQLLVCEVKMDSKISKDNFKKDLDKLLYYKLSQLKFQNAVFIFTGKKELLNQYLNEYRHSQTSLHFLNCLHTNCILFAIPKQKKEKTNNWGIYTIDLGNGINKNCFVK
jgi:hypothetical protein